MLARQHLRLQQLEAEKKGNDDLQAKVAAAEEKLALADNERKEAVAAAALSKLEVEKLRAEKETLR